MEEQRVLEIKHVADLLDMHFHIPCYQRGYRWESKHIEDLLDDLYNFSVQMSETTNKQGKFYCIQPLAVLKNRELSTSAQAVYDVIDGQQRLTTLYLLLSYLQNTREANYVGKLASSIFSLKYESRDSDFFNNMEFKEGDIKKAIRNIDFFYMTRAYKAIESWFERTGTNKHKILKLLIPEDYHCLDGLEGEELRKMKELNDKENDVRFIWYKVPAEEYTDSIEVFSQLNYGKTALTATELVKALLFQCDIYSKDARLMREISFRRSCEWDAMEKQLQDPFMWSMIMPKDTIFPSHITIVLELVFTKLYNDLLITNQHLMFDQNSSDFIYQVCNTCLGTNKDGDYAKNVTEIWEKIQETYTALYNWYKNPDTYHLIGLLLWLKEYKGKDFDYHKRFTLLQEMMEEYRKNIKDVFIKYLKKEIAAIIHLEVSKKTKEGVIPWGLKYINYNDNALQLIRILVVFNVEDIRKQQDEVAKFPFHLLRKFNITSLEHIHPQNLILDNIKLDTLKTWLSVKEESLKQLKKHELYRDDIIKLRSFINDEASYKENKDQAQSIINRIDKEFDDLANMSEGQMHTLYNMALVDIYTNSVLSNNLLDIKRDILRSRQEQGETYVLPSTRKVFSKFYSRPQEANILPKLWTKSDREAYFVAIEQVYNEFDSYYSKD